MAPEQLAGAAADERSDLFSVGVLAHESLVGELPFVSRPRSLVDLRAALAASPHLHPSLRGTPWEDWLTRALARDARRRPASAEEMLRTLPQADA